MKKHTSKKPVTDGELPLVSQNAAAGFNLGTQARAAELFCITGMTDPQLRQAQLRVDATGAPYLPKPAGGFWPVRETLAGLLRYQRDRAAETLPRQCASMKDVESFYGFPVEAQQYARNHGCEGAFESSNRVNILPLFRFFTPLLKKIFSRGAANIPGLEGFEELDADVMLGRVRVQDEIEKKRDNALANGDLRTSQGVEELLGPPLTDIANNLKNYEKTTGAKIRSVLSSAGVPEATVKQVLQVAAAGITEPLAKLRASLEKFPKKEK